MFVRRSVIHAALSTALSTALALATASPAMAEATAPPDCWKPDELAAARVGDLQSTLMVLALKCQETSASTLAAYNKFMADKHDVVLKDKYLIQAHFVRHLGPAEGMKASAAYDTKLGNQNSSPVVNVAKCEQAGAYARIAAGASEDDLPVLAGMVGASAALEACPVVVVAAARPAAMVIPVWNRPVAIPAGGAAPADAVRVQPAVAVVEPGAPATDGAQQPASAPIAATPPANADAVKALQAAVAALSQVAATLQPAAAPPAPAAAPVDTEE